MPLQILSPIKVSRIQLKCNNLQNSSLLPEPVVVSLLFASRTQLILLYLVIQISDCVSKKYNLKPIVLLTYTIDVQGVISINME